MSWFNYIGLIIIAGIMIPNILYAVKQKDGFQNKYVNKSAEVFEQIGRVGCFIFMIFNIPHTYFGFWFSGALLPYIIVNSLLCVGYLVCWAIFWKKSNLAKAISLSLLPSFIFLFSGILLANVPLIVCAIIFAPCHILISCKNVNESGG